jgi:hypothetical protein
VAGRAIDWWGPLMRAAGRGLRSGCTALAGGGPGVGAFSTAGTCGCEVGATGDEDDEDGEEGGGEEELLDAAPELALMRCEGALKV